MQLSVGSFTHQNKALVSEKMVPSEGRGLQSYNFIFLFCLTLPGCENILHGRSAEAASLVPASDGCQYSSVMPEESPVVILQSIYCSMESETIQAFLKNCK